MTGSEIMSSIITGIVAGGIPAILATYGLKRSSDLEEKLQKLKQDKVEKLEKRVDIIHAETINKEELKSIEKRLEKQFDRFNDKLDRISEDTARQEALISEQKNYLNNLYSSMQELRKEVHDGRKS